MALLIVGLVLPINGQAKSFYRKQTYCNPMDLPYRFRDTGVSRREAADPDVVFYRGEYWLFCTNGGGYYHSRDLKHWLFVPMITYSLVAPTAIVLDNKLYLEGSGSSKLYAVDDILKARWHKVADLGRNYGDPDLFLDDDGRLYLYWGTSPTDVIHVTELDRHTFRPLRTVAIPQTRDEAHRGWEVRGDHNELYGEKAYIEAPFMTKNRGRYYLQYSAAGTQYKTYGDGVAVGGKAMGPFRYEDYSPFSFKPTGFLGGAGHSTTFLRNGKFWQISTAVISAREHFERRLALFPTRFSSSGEMITDTYLGDYPHKLGGDRDLTGWMLLSRKRVVSASSSMESHPAEKAVDEDIKTWWSAQSGNPGEWLQVDLGGAKHVEAVQIDFADEGSTAYGTSSDGYAYRLRFSSDGVHWNTAIDRKDRKDTPHDYEVLPYAITARYVRLENLHSPNHARFSVSDLRVFGEGGGAKPQQVQGISAHRDLGNPRKATIQWEKAQGAEFYIVNLRLPSREGSQSYQVYDGELSLTVASLNSDAAYEVSVDAVNENGISRGRLHTPVQ